MPKTLRECQEWYDNQGEPEEDEDEPDLEQELDYEEYYFDEDEAAFNRSP